MEIHPGERERRPVHAPGRPRVCRGRRSLREEPALARRDAETTSPRTAEVLSAWDDGALRLTLFREGGPTLGVDHFARREGGADAGLLTRAAPLRGTYRAAARDARGAPVGWLRVRVEPPAAPVYDGVLPDATGDALAAAAAVALDGEVAWIEEHPAERDAGTP